MISFNIFKSFKKPTTIKTLGVKNYQIYASLNRLSPGVDNIHLDVHISSQVHNALKKTAFLLMVKHSGAEFFFKEYKKEFCESEKDALRRICNDVLLDGINKAKKASEVQIDLLAQTALAKLFLEEIQLQYNILVEQIEPLVKMYQLSTKHDQNDVFMIKDKLSEIKRHHHHITRLAGKELFELLADVNTRKLRDMRETHFPPRDILPGFFLANPLLHTNNPSDDFFLIEEYVLMGQRSEDTDNYRSVKMILYDLFGQIDLTNEDGRNATEANERKFQTVHGLVDAENCLYDALIMEPDNIGKMLDFYETEEQYEKAKNNKEQESILNKLKERKEIQKNLLNLFYHQFKVAGLLPQIVANFEMKSVYEKYCPPLSPRQVREFLVNFWKRTSMRKNLKRLKSLYGSQFNFGPLLQTVKHIKDCSTKEKKLYLILFLKQFSRYYRDLYNFYLIQDAMNSINLVTEEKIILLSRENHSLFEFLLPDEKITEEKPIANHVIIKADIRGSITINHTMRKMGLNPASYFSLNFFDPISAVLAEYGAAKVFIEGDAIILSLFENEEASEGNYSVARACGLAIRILRIVHSYNEKNKENNLPELELGIGICYSQDPPTFLFDGDSKIMISQAINQADRLSSCDKLLRKIFKSQNDIFNLFVFENEAEEIIEAAGEDATYRYNVNGIELNEEGFHKLTREINLQTYIFPSETDENIKLYAGKVPLTNGNYQRIAIREAPIHKLQPSALDAAGKITKKYYEVCTHPDIYDFTDKQY